MKTQLDERWQRNRDACKKRQDLKERAITYLGGRCQECGYDRCPAALDFHHPNPQEKEFSISGRTAWSPALEAELDKCILLCANCHRETHAGWHPRHLDFEEFGKDFGEDPDEVLAIYGDDAEDTQTDLRLPFQIES